MNPFNQILDNQQRAAAGQAAALSFVQSVNGLVETLIPSGERSVFELGSDPWQSGSLHATRLGRQGQTLHGLVVYAVPRTGWYRVQLDELNTDMPCCCHTGGKTGIAISEQIPPGTPVLVDVLPGVPYGVIRAAIPLPVVNGSRGLSDWILQGSGVGFYHERYYRDLTTSFSKEGGLRHFDTNQPIDQLSVYERGWHGPLGTALHLDLLTAFMRTSEVNGLWLNWLDDHMRLSGYNLDFRTAGSEQTARNDEGEIQLFRGSTPYPWEAAGQFESGTRATKENQPSEVQNNLHQSSLEPKENDTVPFWRHREYGGYLGQGFRRELVIPPQDKQSPNRRSEDQQPIGVFLEQLGLDGSYVLASAHSISIVKRGMIPVAIQLKEPEDPQGDTAEDYKASGQTGEGPEHRINNPEFSGDDAHVAEVMALADIQAHLFQWKGPHPFDYHEKDWKVEEPSADQNFQKLVTASAFSELTSKTFIPAQPSVKLSPDHRYGESPYYETSSGIFQLPNGGLVIRGAWGEEISLVGGNVLISCPGNVFTMPGRSAVTLAGDDAIIRAKKSIDLSATENDLRLKAKKNLEILAGAGGGQGRLLIENQAQQDTHQYKDKVGEDVEGSGIILKATNSKLISWTAGVYMRTGGGDVQDGDIVIDASKGERSIRTLSDRFYRHIKTQAADSFPVGQTKTVVNSQDAQGFRIDSQILAKGGLYVTEGGMLVRGDVLVLGGHIATERARTNNYLVGGLDPGTEAQRANDQALKQTEKTLSNLRKQLGDDFKDQVKKEYHDDQKIGNDEFQRQTAFSWRNEKQYGTQSGFSLPEPWWQQLAGAAGASTSTWTEQALTYQSRQLMPYPGNDKWTEDTMLQYNLELFDAANGRERDRGEGTYEQFTAQQPTRTSPQGQFKTINPE